MSTTISVKITPQGILIPREELGDLDPQSLEVVREDETIVIRSKLVARDTRNQVRQLIRDAGLLYQPNWPEPPSVSSEEREQLAQKLAHGRPLSEIIIEDRQDRV